MRSSLGTPHRKLSASRGARYRHDVQGGRRIDRSNGAGACEIADPRRWQPAGLRPVRVDESCQAVAAFLPAQTSLCAFQSAAPVSNTSNPSNALAALTAGSTTAARRRRVGARSAGRQRSLVGRRTGRIAAPSCLDRRDKGLGEVDIETGGDAAPELLDAVHDGQVVGIFGRVFLSKASNAGDGSMKALGRVGRCEHCGPDGRRRRFGNSSHAREELREVMAVAARRVVTGIG